MKHQDLGTSEPDISIEAIIQALETPPTIAVAPDFSRRVMQRIPAQRRRSTFADARALSPRYGTAAALLAVVALLLALVLLPFHNGSPVMQAATEVLLLADLFAIALWLFNFRWRAH